MSTLQSLKNHLKTLEDRHRTLDKKVSEDYDNHLNSREYTIEKKEKLQLKDEIETLKKVIDLKEQDEKI
jgi:hypothetical protein